MIGNAFPAVIGYPGTVWNAVLASLEYVNSQLPTLGPNNSASVVSGLAQTLRNARDTLDAYILGQAAGAGFATLNTALSLPVPLSPSDLGFIQTRMAALRSFALALDAMQAPPASSASIALSNGQPVVADPLLLEYLVNFSSEVPPPGLTASDFAAQAQAAAQAWANFAAAAAQIANGTELNEMNTMASVSFHAAGALTDISLSSNASLTTAWNGMVAIPSIAAYASADASNPTSAFYQQITTMQNIIMQALDQAYILLVNLRQAIPAAVNLATVLQGDSLMTIAARELSDYTQWPVLAQINGLLPPYISTTPGPNVASPGQQIYLPTPGVTTNSLPAQNQIVLNYLTEFLGTDIWYGPINQDMLPWTGDLQTISGNQNLAFSLGRRVQTTLGTLTYHVDYGSRVPPEVGKVTTSDTARHLGAYAKSAALSDARVAQVLSVTTTVLTSWAIDVQFVALPKGMPNGKNTIPVTASVTGGLSVSIVAG